MRRLVVVLMLVGVLLAPLDGALAADGAPAIRSASSVDVSQGPQVTTTITVGGNPGAVDVDPRLNLAYVAIPSANQLDLISTVTNHVVTTTPLPDAGAIPQAVGADRRSGAIYVGAGALPKTYVTWPWPQASGKKNPTLSLAAPTTGLTIGVDPYADRVLVSQGSAGTVRSFTINPTFSFTDLAVGSGPSGVAVDVDPHRAYVANSGSGTVSVVDTIGNSVTATIAVGTNPTGVAVNPATHRIYVTNSGSNTLSVIDGTSNKIIATVPVGHAPAGVGVNPGNSRVYVANTSDNTLSIIDGIANKVLGTPTVGSAPAGVAVNPNINTIYVANAGSGTVTVVTDVVTLGPPTTRTVAPSCSGQPPPCTTTIQAAVNAANPGDVISIQPGTYPENVRVKTPVTIQGATGQTQPVINAGGGGFGIYVAAWNVTIQNLQIIGATAADSTATLALATGAVVVDLSARNTTIQTNQFPGNRRGVVGVGENLTIANNTITSSLADGILLSQGSLSQHLYPGGQSLQVTGNTVTGSGGNGITSEFADFMNVLAIGNNTISGTTGTPIEACCYVSQGPVASLTVTGNNVSENSSNQLVDACCWINNVNNLQISSVNVTNNVVSNASTSTADLVDLCCVANKVDGIQIGSITVTGNQISGHGELDFCCPLEEVNDVGPDGSTTISGATSVSIGPTAVGPITFSNNVASGGSTLEFCCPLEAVADPSLQNTTGTIAIGPTSVGDIVADANQVNGGGTLDICCPLEGVNDPSISGNSGTISIAKLAVGNIVADHNQVSGGGDVEICCPIEGANDPSITGNSGTITIGKLSVGSMSVTNNTVTDNGLVDFCCPIEGANDPNISNQTAGSISIGELAVGDMLVSGNSATGSEGVEACCPTEGVVQPNLSNNTGGTIGFANVSIGTFTVTQNTASGTNAFIDACCATEDVSTATIDSANKANVTFGATNVGAVSITNNSLTTTNPTSTEPFDVNAFTEQVGGVTISSGNTGKITPGTVQVGAVAISGNTVSGAGLDVSRADTTVASNTTEGPITIANNQITNSKQYGIQLGSTFSHLGSGGQNPSVTVSGNTITGSGIDGIEAPDVASLGTVTITGNSVSNSSQVGILITQTESAGLTLSHNTLNNNAFYGIGTGGAFAPTATAQQSQSGSARQHRDAARQRLQARRRATTHPLPRLPRLTAEGTSIAAPVSGPAGPSGSIVVTQNNVTAGNGGDTALDNTAPGTITWYDATAHLGNYWSDYVAEGGSDGDGDGIGDTPYGIPGSSGAQDLYPLMNPAPSAAGRGT